MQEIVFMIKSIRLIATTTIATALLLFAQPVLAASTWIPEYQAGKSIYTSPELQLKDIQQELDTASKSEGMKFISVNTIRGDDLPQEQYAQNLNDRLVSTWTTKPDFPVNDYVTLVYVRHNTNPAKGSFSINVGSKWRGNFSPSALTNFQVPILKQYMPQDPSGGIVAIADGLNNEVVWQRNTGIFLLWLGGIFAFLVSIYFVRGWALKYLDSRKKKKADWDKFLARFGILESSYRATFDELQYLNLVEYSGDSLKLFNDINAVFTAVSTDFEKALEQKGKHSWVNTDKTTFADLKESVDATIRVLESLNSEKITQLKTSREIAELRLAELKERVSKLNKDHEGTPSLIVNINSLNLSPLLPNDCLPNNSKIQEPDCVGFLRTLDKYFQSVAEIEEDVVTYEEMSAEVRSLMENVKSLPSLVNKEFSAIDLICADDKWLRHTEEIRLPEIYQKKILDRIFGLREVKADLNKYWLPYIAAIADRDRLKQQVKNYKKALSTSSVPKHLQSRQNSLIPQLNHLGKELYTLTLRPKAEILFQDVEKWLQDFKKYTQAKQKIKSYSSSRKNTAEPYLERGEYDRIDSLVLTWDSEDRSSRDSSSSSYSSWSESSSSSSWDSSSSSSSWDSSSSSSSWDSSSSGSDW